MPITLFERAGPETAPVQEPGSSQSSPELIRLDAGRYLLIWGEDEIRGQIFANDGSKIGSEFDIFSAVTDPESVAAATLADGSFVVVSIVNTLDAGSVIFQRFDANGGKLGGEVVANTTLVGFRLEPAIAALDGGGFAITWTDLSRTGGDTSGTAIRGQVFGATGVQVGSEFLVNSTTNRDQDASVVTALDDGGFAVAFRDKSPQGTAGQTPSLDLGTNIALQIFDAMGAKVGAQRDVDAFEPPAAFSSGEFRRTVATDAAIATLTDGRIVVAWVDELRNLVLGRVLLANGDLVSQFTIDGERGSELDIAVLPNGNFVVTWTSAILRASDQFGESVRARVFDGDGVAQGGAFQVNSAVAGNQGDSSVLAKADGSFVVAWEDLDSGSDQLRSQSFAPSLGVISDIAASSATLDQASIENVPVAALTSSGALNAEFSYEILGDTLGGGTFRIEDGRLVLANSGRVVATLATSVDVSLRVTDNNGNSYDEVLTLALQRPASASIYRAEAESTLVSRTSAYTSPQQVEFAQFGDGRILVTFAAADIVLNNQREIFGRILNTDGSVAVADFRVNSAAAGQQLQHRSAALENGNVVVIFNSSGTNVAGGSDTNVFSSGLRGQIFSATGARVGSEFTVNTVVAGNQQSPAVTGLAAGGFAVAFQDGSATGADNNGSGIKVQLFTEGGAKVGGEIVVNTTIAGNQSAPQIAELANGRLVVTWIDPSATGGDTSNSTVRARLLNADGTAFGAEFVVPTTTFGAQRFPVVEALDNGTFVILWRDNGEAGETDANTFTAGDIRGQIFDGDGVRVGSEFLVNSQTVGGQGEAFFTGTASIAADRTGGFTVFFLSYADILGDGDGSAVKGQRFDATGARLGAEFLVNALGAGQQGLPNLIALANGDLLAGWGRFGELSQDDNVLQTRRFSLIGEVRNGTAGDDNAFGSVSDDLLNFSQGGSDTADGGDGNDGIYFGAAFDPTDEVDGGDGAADQLGLRGSYDIVLAATTIVGVEGLALLSSSDTSFDDGSTGPFSYLITSNDANVGAGEQLVVNANGLQAGENFTFNGAAETDGTFRFFGGLGTEDLTGGQGSDGFFFGDGRLAPTDSVDGFTGADDQLGLRGDFSALIVFGSTTIRNIDTIALISSGDARFGQPGTAFSYNLQLHDDNLAADAVLVVTGTDLESDETLTLDGSLESNGFLVLRGGAGADMLTGGGRADELFGNAGADQLRGGGGGDLFIYRALTDSVAAAQDVLLDFAPGDRIDLGFIDANTRSGGSNEAFEFIGGGAFAGDGADAPGQIRAEQVSQSGSERRWLVSIDADRDGAIDMVIEVRTGLADMIEVSDFVL